MPAFSKTMLKLFVLVVAIGLVYLGATHHSELMINSGLFVVCLMTSSVLFDISR